MNKQNTALAGAIICGWLILINAAQAQGTAFTYQGQLNSGGAPANGIYELEFTLFATNQAGNAVAGPITNVATSVSNGLFTATLDFGAGIFTGGGDYWLQVAVQTNGGSGFTALNPLQRVTPAPYAIFAPNAGVAQTAVSASSISAGGTVPLTALPPSVVTNGASGVNITGTFNGTLSGDGARISNAPTPTITNNVIQHGVVGDGVTDDTVAMQALWNVPGGYYYLGTNTYLLGKMQITNDITLIMNGCTLLFKTSEVGIFIRQMLNSNLTIMGQWTLDGLQYGDGDITTNEFFSWNNSGFALNAFNPSTGNIFGYWQPQAQGCRHAFQFNTEGNDHISAPTIRGFSGAALIPLSVTGSSGYLTPKSILEGANCYDNLIGLYSYAPYTFSGYVTNWQAGEVPGAQTPEYFKYQNLNLTANTVGMVVSAANCTYSAPIVSGNLINILDLGSAANGNHCVINGGIFNHAIQSMIIAEGVLQGEVYTGCQFRGNSVESIMLQGCTGIVFQDSQFDIPMVITNFQSRSGQYNYFKNNTYSGSWLANFTINTDGNLGFEGNYSYNTPQDLITIPLTASGATNTGGRTGYAVVTTASSTFWITNTFGLPVLTNASVGVFPIASLGCIHAASGLAGFIYYPN